MYEQQFDRVLTYINSNLDETITTLELSDIAGFSQYHFHRLFVGHFAINVGRYIKLCRFKQACYQLAFRQKMSLLDIAQTCGYENASSFSREFKNISGIAPSTFRKEANWSLCNRIIEPLDSQIKKPISELKSKKMQPSKLSQEVKIIHFPDTRVACLEHRGAPNKVMESVGKFIQWRKQYGSSPKHSDTYNILYDDPSMVEPFDYRFDVCASIKSDLKPNEWGVIEKTIPGGHCAVMRHLGSEHMLGHSIRHLYSNWLGQSEYSLRDYPCFIKRLTFYPEVPEHEMQIDIYLPIK
jgi:AraC family transcriptional regulator